MIIPGARGDPGRDEGHGRRKERVFIPDDPAWLCKGYTRLAVLKKKNISSNLFWLRNTNQLARTVTLKHVSTLINLFITYTFETLDKPLHILITGQ